jgi:antirestriction protein ArdC
MLYTSHKGAKAMHVYEIVTDKILKQLESGVAPWRKPWTSQPPMNLISQKEYRGLNTFLLGSQGYGSRYWLTFNQASKLGGHIKAGEKSSLVIFWNIGEETIRKKPDGSERKSKPILLRYYSVFNLQQTEGIAEKLGLDKQPALIPSLEDCEAIVANMPNPPSREQSDKAWYKPAADTVGMPNRSLFNSPQAYYATLFHELTHSTGHVSRLSREGIMEHHAFGDADYSREELVAEMGAAMLCGVTGIEPAVIDNSVAYLQNWIRVLKGDSKLLVTAASAAQKAADYIRSLSKPEVSEAPEVTE